MSSLYPIQVKTATGKMIPMSTYQGKVMLIVNTASKCGFTSQFRDLQLLHFRYEDKGLVVLGFPCGQFNNQEFDDLSETINHCQLNFGVTFPMFAKLDVKGNDASPLFRHLTTEKRGLLGSSIKWNFTKFLINRQGQIVKRYAPQTNPAKIANDIEALL